LRLLEEPILKPLAEAVIGLPAAWRTLASARPDVSSITHAAKLLQEFPDWIRTGKSDILTSDMSGLVTLPLLTIIHIVQYFDYLQRTRLSHSDFLRSVQAGGIQGYCIGLLSAMIVASSKDEEHVVQNAAAGLRLSLGMGALGDQGHNTADSERITMAIRLRNLGDDKEITKRFPGVSILFSHILLVPVCLHACERRIYPP
jgi:hypothetical protein